MSERFEPSSASATPGYQPSNMARSGSATSVIGPTLVIKGEVTAEEDLLIRGKVEGRIEHNQTLTVHADGSVMAAVKAKEILVEGEVQGDVFGTERVKVCETGRVIGNVYAPRVGVMEGATFKGMVDMDSDAGAIEARFAELTGRPAAAMPQATTTESAAHDDSKDPKDVREASGGKRKSHQRRGAQAQDRGSESQATGSESEADAGDTANDGTA